MVGVAETKAQACIQVRDPHGIGGHYARPLSVTRAGTIVRSEEIKDEPGAAGSRAGL